VLLAVSNEVNQTSESESSQTLQLQSSCLSLTSSASCSYSNVNIRTEHEETVMQPEQVSLFTYVNECACELYDYYDCSFLTYFTSIIVLYANSVCSVSNSV